MVAPNGGQELGDVTAVPVHVEGAITTQKTHARVVYFMYLSPTPPFFSVHATQLQQRGELRLREALQASRRKRAPGNGTGGKCSITGQETRRPVVVGFSSALRNLISAPICFIWSRDHKQTSVKFIWMALRGQESNVGLLLLDAPY